MFNIKVFKPRKNDVLDVIRYFSGVLYCLPIILIFDWIAPKFNIQIGLKTFLAYSILFLFLYMFQDIFKNWFMNIIERIFFNSDKAS